MIEDMGPAPDAEPEGMHFHLPDMPERVPVVMSGEGVGQMFEATKEFIEEHTRAEFGRLFDPVTRAEQPVALTVDGSFKMVDLSIFDDANGAPRHRRGFATFTNLSSFIAHIQRFGDKHSAVFVNDSSTPSLRSVLDYHEADKKGERGQHRFGKHGGSFAFPLSDEWQAWSAKNGKVMKMAEFAAFIEKHVGDLGLVEDALPEETARFVEMNGGISAVADFSALITLSRGLKIHESANVEEAVNLSSGEGQIRFEVAHKATVGNGMVRVPTMFFIAIPIFRKGHFYRIAASLRYRKTNEGLVFWYDLWRADRAFDHAVTEAVQEVSAAIDGQVFYGSPEA